MKSALLKRAAVLALCVSTSTIEAPLLAQEIDHGCQSWVAEMQDDEGGPVLTAHACSQDNGQAILSLKCFAGTVLVEYDMARDGSRDPDYDETARVEFVTDDGIETVEMSFMAMTATFGADLRLEAPLLALLRKSEGVLVRPADGGYPARTYSLDGSAAAITALAAQCR